jgi:hypothetical protein
VVADFAGAAGGTSADAARALAVQADGKLVAAGSADTAAGGDFAVARYRAQ